MNNKRGKQNRKVKNKSFTSSKLNNNSTNSTKKKIAYKKAILLLAAASPRPIDSGLRIEPIR